MPACSDSTRYTVICFARVSPLAAFEQSSRLSRLCTGKSDCPKNSTRYQYFKIIEAKFCLSIFIIPCCYFLSKVLYLFSDIVYHDKRIKPTIFRTHTTSIASPKNERCGDTLPAPLYCIIIIADFCLRNCNTHCFAIDNKIQLIRQTAA